MFLLSRRGPVSVKTKKGVIQTNVIDSIWDEREERVILKTDLATKYEGEPIVIDIYLLDVVEKIWARENGKILFRRDPDDIRHISVRTSFWPTKASVN